MAKDEERRIGIFEYDWSLYSFLKDFVVKLAEAGYAVDLFQKNPGTSLSFADAEQFREYRHVRYFDYKASNPLVRRTLRRLRELWRRFGGAPELNLSDIIDRDILLRSKQIVDATRYQCFIGVEKKGLIWAAALSPISGCPLIYYSLELYLEDHPGLAADLATREYSHLREMEKKCHQLCGATIIQDRLRAKVLAKYNGLESTTWLYLPISVRGDIVERKSSYFSQESLACGAKTLLLYFGLIQDERFSADLVRMASRLNDDVILVLHGYGDPAYLAHLQSIAGTKRVIFSFDLVKEDKISDVISSATIGLALYENTNSNDRLAAFSSVKLAYYMQCGVPVIGFHSESFRELMNAFRCGELIASIDEIPQAVEKILSDYDGYREQAFMAFKQFYSFDGNFQKFVCDLDNFIETNAVS